MFNPQPIGFGLVIDIAQTIVLTLIACVLIYVVLRFEMQLRVWTKLLREVNEQIVGRDAAIDRLWKRIEALEQRLSSGDCA